MECAVNHPMSNASGCELSDLGFDFSYEKKMMVEKTYFEVPIFH